MPKKMPVHTLCVGITDLQTVNAALSKLEKELGVSDICIRFYSDGSGGLYDEDVTELYRFDSLPELVEFCGARQFDRIKAAFKAGAGA